MPISQPKDPAQSAKWAINHADEGVLPSEMEIKKYKMKIVNLANTTHNEMDNNANKEQRKELQEYVLKFINE